MSDEDFDPVRRRHRDLERIANVSLRVARVLMESGASVHIVHQGAAMVARGLGSETVGMRSGYASLEITVGAGENTITRMLPVGRLGVNHRLDMAVRDLARSVAEKGALPGDVDTALDRLVTETPRHAPWFVAVATGTACAAFGRLLGIDWLAFAPVLLAGSIGQWLRHHLLSGGFNLFVVAAIISFVSAALGGAGSLAVGSHTVELAMMASILLLVPGVPATNAQTDIMEGYPTVGSARAVWVIMVMVFAATGVWLAEALMGIRS